MISGSTPNGEVPVEIRIEQEVRIGNDDGVRGRMSRKRVEVDVGMRSRALAIRGKRGIKFANVIQRATAIRLIFT